MSWHPNDLGSAGQMMHLARSDYCDNVLLEILVAFCLMKEKRIQSFTPIFTGGVTNDMYESFPFAKVGDLPDIVSQKTLDVVEEAVQKLGLVVPPDIRVLSVRAAIKTILDYQGIKIAELGTVLNAQETAARKLLDL